MVFVTQTPKDIPADVLAQLGSRIQHALRVVTPADNKKLKQSIETFPESELDLAEVLTNLGIGQALVTVLDPDGRPTPVMPVSVWAPASVMGSASEQIVSAVVASSPLVARYAQAVNPYSAEETLRERGQTQAAARAAKEEHMQRERQRQEREAQKRWEKEQASARKATQKRQDALQSALGAVLRSAGSALGKEITRSIFGTRRR